MSSSSRSSSVAAFLLASILPSRISGGGVQTGPSPGSFHPGGMFYDVANQMLYTAGLHYNKELDDDDKLAGNSLDSQSNCFIASIEMGSEDAEFEAFHKWVSWGNPDVLETCSSITAHNPSQLVVIGNTAPGGFLPNTDPEIMLSGMVAVGDKGSLDFLAGLPILSSSSPQLKILYPMAVASDGAKAVYIAAMTSTDNVPTNDLGDDATQPNWQEYIKYGATVYMSVLKIYIHEGEIKGVPKGDIQVEEVWTREYPIELNGDEVNPSVSIGGLIVKRDVNNRELLIISGSTRGVGNAYGSAVGDDEDGFLTVLDPSTGELYAEITNQRREGSTLDDIVSGICDDVNDPNSFFIVGATKGDLGEQQADLSVVGQPNANTLQPFLRKVSIEVLKEDWTIQWAPKPSHDRDPSSASFAYASACAVHGDNVFVTGTIESGAGMVQGAVVHPSHGGSDVWVAKVEKSTGNVDWINQLGTDGDEEIAGYGGILVEKDGDPIILGETTGSMFRRRMPSDDFHTDMFVMSLDGGIGAVQDTSFLGGNSLIKEVQEQNDSNSVDTPVPAPGDDPVVDEQPMPDTEPPRDEEKPTDATDPPIEEENDPLPDTDAPIEEDHDERPPDVTPDHQYMPLGMQFAGPAYAGGITYDSGTNTVLVAGSGFSLEDGSPSETSRCFMRMVDLDSAEIDINNSFGSDDYHEACSSVAYDQENDLAYAIGSAQSGNGEFAESSDWDRTVPDSKESGIVLQLHGDIRLMGGQRLADYPVVFPTAIEASRGYVYIVSMASENPTENQVEEREHPNFTAGGPEKYGTDYFLKIDKFRVSEMPDRYYDPLPATLEQDWEARFRVDDRGELEVMGMALLGAESLVVVGFTNGSGGPFKENNGNDFDGWILKIDPSTGQPSSKGSISSGRIDSIDKKDDYIYNICEDQHPSRNLEYFYVVGSTEGKIQDLADNEQLPEGSIHAFVARVRVDDLTVEWTKHFTMNSPNGGLLGADATSCAVYVNDAEESIVYVGGTAYDGAVMDGADIRQSHGGDDIFVAAVDGNTGAVKWVSQIGSDEHDSLPFGQGLEIDLYGNVIVLGETLGSIYADHGAGDGEKDLVIFTIKQDGTYLDPRVHGDGGSSTRPPYNGPIKTSSESSDSAVIGYTVAAAFIVFMAMVCLCFSRHLKKKQAMTDKAAIFTYLQKFDVEDVDLRRSPPGGWHGTYLNKLAYGINKAAESSLDSETGNETAPLTHSSVVTDSLFMETSSRPSLGLTAELEGIVDQAARPGREVV